MNNVFILSGPAGSGKDSVIDGLTRVLPLERIVTSTTRAMRDGESEGHPYHFLSRQVFEEKVERGEFVEYSTNENGEFYGVTRDELSRIEKTGRIAIWKIEWKGVMSVKKLFPEIPAIFVSASSDILESRLRRRDGETQNEAYFAERRKYTENWLKDHTDIYDYQVENEEGKLDETIEKVRRIIEAHLNKTGDEKLGGAIHPAF